MDDLLFFLTFLPKGKNLPWRFFVGLWAESVYVVLLLFFSSYFNCSCMIIFFFEHSNELFIVASILNLLSGYVLT